MNLSQRPGEHECFDYHRDYVAKVPDGDILVTLAKQNDAARQFIESIAAEELPVVHAPYAWSIQTALEHCCDAERIFGYRALRFAAGDKTDLPGWNENQYAASGYGHRASAAELAAEFHSLRAANLLLLRRLEPAAWERLGTADGRCVSVRTLAWLMAGHWSHHATILQKRLNGAPV